MFWHRLAVALGMSIAQAQAEISPDEFRSWVAFDRIEPLGGRRADIHAGIIASVVANCNRAKNGKAFKPEDFIPKWGERQKAADPAMLARKLDMFTKIHNASIENKASNRKVKG
jgi:hypothetical protein